MFVAIHVCTMCSDGVVHCERVTHYEVKDN